MRGYSGVSGWVQYSHKDPYKKERGLDREIWRSYSADFKLEDRPMNQGMQVASRSWKRQENGFAPKTTRRSRKVLPTP